MQPEGRLDAIARELEEKYVRKLPSLLELNNDVTNKCIHKLAGRMLRSSAKRCS